MSHPYTDHYPSGPDTNQRLDDHEKRIKELESKLGAADRTSAVTAAKPTESATGTTAAPSVSAEEWRAEAYHCLHYGYGGLDRACDLAAAVTEWYESDEGGDHDEADLMDIVGAFVRGEPLPEKRNG